MAQGNFQHKKLRNAVSSFVVGLSLNLRRWLGEEIWPLQVLLMTAPHPDKYSSFLGVKNVKCALRTWVKIMETKVAEIYATFNQRRGNLRLQKLTRLKLMH